MLTSVLSAETLEVPLDALLSLEEAEEEEEEEEEEECALEEEPAEEAAALPVEYTE